MESVIIRELIGSVDGFGILMLFAVLFLYWRLNTVETTITRKLDNGLASGLRRVEESVARIEATCAERSRQHKDC